MIPFSIETRRSSSAPPTQAPDPTFSKSRQTLIRETKFRGSFQLASEMCHYDSRH